MAAPRWVVVFLVIGLMAASQSGNIIRLGDAHPVAIAFWRLVIASCLFLPFAARRFGTLRALGRLDLVLLGLAGAALAGHFFTWIAAVQLTTVANAAIFFAVNPVITATAGYLIFRERPTPRLFASIGLGLLGVLVIGGGDLRFDPSHVKGDVMAVVCSFLFTAYFLLGKRLRQKLPNHVYVTALYGVAAVVSFVVLLWLGLPVAGYAPATWLCFVLMALVPTMLGHTSFNAALKYIHAGRISAATLTEPLLAGLVAFFAWGEGITVQVAVGYALICASVLVLAMDRPSARAV